MGKELYQILKIRFFSNFVPKFVHQNQNLMPLNHDFDSEFGIWVPKIHFQKSKIKLSYSARISFRDHQIRIQRHRFTRHIFFIPKFKFFLCQNLDFVLGYIDVLSLLLRCGAEVEIQNPKENFRPLREMRILAKIGLGIMDCVG